jgi:GMP synthase (glutamine-hydrolysing)
MILIVNVCSDRLSYFEFVKPVEDIVRKAGFESVTKRYFSVGSREVSGAERVIICGTALRDFRYLEDIGKFAWVREADEPMLGICAGMQILVKLFGGELVESLRVGRYRVRVVRDNSLAAKGEFYSYFLNSMSVEPNESFEIIGASGKLKCIIRHRNRRLYGSLFHPEVLNPGIITNFLREPAPKV